MPDAHPLLYPVGPRRADVTLWIDDREIPACRGESLITALLAAGEMTGRSEFDQTPRSGFCLMGACQDCTIWTATGQRLRACMTEVRDGMVLRRQPPAVGVDHGR